MDLEYLQKEIAALKDGQQRMLAEVRSLRAEVLSSAPETPSASLTPASPKGASTRQDLLVQLSQLAANVQTTVTRLTQKIAEQDARESLPRDQVVSQDTAHMDRKLFLKMAKAGAFPFTPEGRGYLAVWGDVLDALERGRIAALPSEAVAGADGKNRLRAAMGLAPTGKR